MARTLRTQDAPKGRTSLRSLTPDPAPPDSPRGAGAHRPLSASATVPRRRLLALLDAGAQQPLTVLSAPAGYGKSVLAGDWVSHADTWAGVAHTSLTEDGEALVDFWTAALRTLDASGVDTSGLHGGPSPEDVDPVLVREIGRRIRAHDRPVVWVIDCDEFTLSRPVAQGLHRLLSASRGSLRLVLLTRSDPPLPLHRYRLAGQLTEVRAAELAFTASEVAAVMEHAGLELRPDEVSDLYARTSGWPAGLRFAAMWLGGRRDTAQAIRDFRGDTANVGAYLMSEVLAKQPPEMQQFLVRTCVADTLHPGLVGALTGRHCDDRVLQFMSHGNTFIVAAREAEGAYRYQPLFREFLRSELAYRYPGLGPELHRSAATWLAANGRHRLALKHAVAARAWGDAARCLLEGPGVAALFVGPDRAALQALVAAVPAEAPGPGPALARAALALSEADAEVGLAELASARRWMDAQAPPWSAADTALLTLSAVAAGLGTDRDVAVEAALAAESTVLTTTTTDAGPDTATATLLAAAKGRALLERGDVMAASEAFSTAAAAATTAGFAWEAVELRGVGALAEAAAGNLRRAHALATWTAPDAVRATRTPTVARSCKAGALAMAWVLVERYDLADAATVLAEVPRLPTSREGRILPAVHALVRARLLRAQGQVDLAIASVQALRGEGPSAAVASGWLGHALVTAEADYLLEAGRPEEARALLAGVEACEHPACALVVHRAALAQGRAAGEGDGDHPHREGASTVQTRVARELVRAQERLRAGDREEAERSVEAALALALPEHLRRPFFESPATVRELLEDTGRMSRLRQQTRSSSHQDADIALTAREQEVLGHLAELLTTEEIAQAMFVSVNTVRTHVRSVLRKLDVSRRNEAVRRAWEQDLLPGRPRGVPPPDGGTQGPADLPGSDVATRVRRTSTR